VEPLRFALGFFDRPAYQRYLDQAVRLRGFMIYHGDADSNVPVEHARIFEALLTNLGVDHVCTWRSRVRSIVPSTGARYSSSCPITWSRSTTVMLFAQSPTYN